MTRTQLSRPAVSPPADLTLVEASLAQVISKTSQSERAQWVGLSGHGQISRREQKLTTGEADTYLEVYPGHYLLRVAKANPVLRESVVDFLNGEEVEAGDAVKDLTSFAQHAAVEIAAILGDLSDGKIDRIEAARHSTALQQLQELIHQARLDLGRLARTPGATA